MEEGKGKDDKKGKDKEHDERVEQVIDKLMQRKFDPFRYALCFRADK